jgi:UDP-N-acetylglucosamine 2-epimerase (non-hydrolysing)
MNRSYLILTDSGGIQEEAPSLGKPVLVTRNHTERLEAIEAGSVKLTGTDPEILLDQARRLLYNKNDHKKMVVENNPYGDGKAAYKILEILKTL